MENPEEVLQALDEFQKMRPSEIPRELEDYLCWVAKTGDPVYQWSLIKVLFREKLARVMTDFYEACPNIDGLAACPNVEHFNYDTMKSSLLERLESFANAPFTVQRICELLTSPRKEYNRIDKFMRAIEKNILVVSTREPGPTIRRSENGEGMVNGSVEDELAQGSQPSDEMEMETWVKDCGPTAATLPLNVSSEDGPQHSSILGQNTSVVKQLSSVNGSTESDSKPSLQATPDLDTIGPSFVSSSSEFTESSSSDSSSSGPESVAGMSNVTSVVQETSSIVGEVPEAIINEDTSSQPSLDLETDESECERTTPLQTTFPSKSFLDSYKEKEEKQEVFQKEAVPEVENSQEEKVPEEEEPVNVSDLPENLESHEVRQESTIVENSGATSVITETPSVSEVQQEVRKEEEEKQEEEEEKEKQEKPEEQEEEEQKEAEEKEEDKVEEKKLEEPLECGETIPDGAAEECESQCTIEETTEDNTETNSLVPEPIPIVEEPKEPEDEPKKWEGVSVIEATEEPERKVEIVAMAGETDCEPPKKVMIIEECAEKKEESMEVDTDTPPAEPMDQSEDASESAS